MGFLLCSSVMFGLFVTALQIEANRLPWKAVKKQYKPYSGRLPYDDHPEALETGALLQQPPSAVEPVREPGLPQSRQILEGPMKLQWNYPQMLPEPEVPVAQVVPTEPVPVDSVAVRCGEADVQVEVDQDFFGIGQLIRPADMTLGDCAATGEDSSAQVLLFESELHRCGSQLQTTGDELVYTFTLVYNPKVIDGTSILRTNNATVSIECRYQRAHNVSSDVIGPTWAPFAATKVAEEVLVFSLRLMTGDWTSERASNTYYLGDLLHIEASVIQYGHVPLRVFVHSCVATAVPDVNASPRYSFIENHGCLLDAKLTGSRSRFLPRDQDDKLRLELEAFRFAQEDSNEIYIACLLVATATSTDSDHKACSFSSDGWTSAVGNDEACQCCDTTCGTGPTTDQWQSVASLGPVLVQ